MTETIVLFPPPTDGALRPWLQVVDGDIAAEGEGAPPLPPLDKPMPRVVAVAPADAVALHWATLPDRSMAQSVAAARLVVAEAVVAPSAELHVAVGREPDVAERPIGVVDIAVMQHWLVDLARDGIDPDAIVPAPLLLPRPDDGFVRADLAGQAVVRGQASGFADEARLTELIAGDAPLETLPRDRVTAAIVAGAADPVLNLRQGPFAKRRRRAIDWALVRRLALLAAAIIGVTILISLFRIGRTEVTAAAIETRADMIARQALPSGETVTDPERQLAARLESMRGAGLGFSTMAAATFSAIQAVPGTELTALSFDQTGALKVTVTAQGEAAANDLKHRIEDMGFTVDASTFTQNGGQVSGDLTVTS